MNQPTPYESQIKPTDDGFIINPNYSFNIKEILYITDPFFINFIEIFFWHKITITPKHIKRGQKIIYLRDIPYIDFHIIILENKISVSIENIRFDLRNTEDLPVLTEGIAKIANLEFYESYQLTDKTEILTYKSKKIAKPRFVSFLNIRKQGDKIKTYDIINNLKWFRIDKNRANSKIHYSHPKGYDSTGNQDVYLRSIGIYNIEKIFVIVNQKSSFFSRSRNLEIALIEKNPPKIGFFSSAKIFYKNGYHYIFRTNKRNSKGELINWRDGEMVYNLLIRMKKSTPSSTTYSGNFK